MARPQRGARTQQRQRRQAAGLSQLPRGPVRTPYPPMAILSDDQVEAIHHASLQVLRDIGVNFLLPEARDILAAAGAMVDGPRVRFDPAMVAETITTIPPSFRLHARNPARSVDMGGNNIVVTSVGSPPNASDLARGRRPGNFADFQDFLRLSEQLNVCQVIGGYPVEPVDVPTHIRHLKATQAIITLTESPLFGYSLGRRRILDVIEMTRIARGIDDTTLMAEPSLFTIVNANSPLQYDVPMLKGVIELARRGQVVCFTPFTLAGAMAPVSLAGALTQQNAEALAGFVLAQVVRPGAPVIYGGFTSNVDMRTGAPAFGTPEYAQAVIAGGQLARRYGVPYRSSNTNASNAPDEQAVYETMMSLWPCFLAHCNFLKHGLGWLEGGLTASFEKMVLDAEMIQMMVAFLKPLDLSVDELGLEAMAEVGPGGHFFGASHTMARYETAFYRPLLSDWRNFETWRESGAETAGQRAHRLYQALLADYRPPAMDPAVAEELDAFVTRRIADGGADQDAA